MQFIDCSSSTACPGGGRGSLAMTVSDSPAVSSGFFVYKFKKSVLSLLRNAAFYYKIDSVFKTKSFEGYALWHF